MTSSEIEAPPSWPARLLRSRWMQAERFAIWFPLTVFFVTRAVNAVMFGLASGRQIAIPFTGLGGKLAIASPASPDYCVVAANWDGRWYGAIATYGYSDHLPLDSAGHVLQNVYAFPPLYPMLVRFLMLTTGLDFTKGRADRESRVRCRWHGGMPSTRHRSHTQRAQSRTVAEAAKRRAVWLIKRNMMVTAAAPKMPLRKGAPTTKSSR